MKTNALLSIQIMGLLALFMISCSKDDTNDHWTLPVSAPILYHVVDTVYTPFFTSGTYGMDLFLFWGYEKGNLYITAPQGVLIKNQTPYVLSWDHNLDLGNYTISMKAENSLGTAKDSFILVSRFGGNFIRTYNYHPESSVDGLSIGQPVQFDQKGWLNYSDPWDSENSFSGKWSWISDNKIQASYSKGGQLNNYSFQATFGYNNIDGLPKLNGYWYEGEVPVPGEEKGYISFNFDKDSVFTNLFYRHNMQWVPGFASEDYPQIYHPYDPIEKQKFGGWFTAFCGASPYEKGYRLYLGVDKKIFRGKKTDTENWSWVSDKEIQGTFMKHSDFLGSDDNFISFKGTVSMANGLPFISGYWYSGKEVIQGREAGEIKMYYENWDDWWGAGW